VVQTQQILPTVLTFAAVHYAFCDSQGS
jgi:hypothetical protein